MRSSLLLPLLLIYTLLVGWKSPLRLDEGTIGEDLAHKASYLEDPGNEMKIGEVLRKDSSAFKPVKGERGNFGFSTSTFWMRFSIHNRTDSDLILLNPSRPLTDDIRLYRVEGDHVVDTMRSGDHTSFSERPFPDRYVIFPLDLDPGEKAEIFIRIEGEGGTVTFLLRAWPFGDFLVFDQAQRFLMGLFFGILSFVVLIFAFFYFSLKERSFLYYFLYVLVFAFFQFSLEGFTHRYFFPDSPYFSDRAVVSSSALSVLMLALYVRSYLRLWKYSFKLDIGLRSIMVLAGVALFASFFEGWPYRLSYPFVNGLSFFGTLYILGSIILLRFYLRVRVSIFFLTAFALLITGVIYFLLGNNGVIPPSALNVNGLKLGALGEVIFLSFTMAEKYRELQREKEEARKDSLERLEELNRMKDAYNKELEETVKARTIELEEERGKLEERNQEIFSSIRYAQRIQNAILAPERTIGSLFRDHFVFYRPRDIVSGDIYWLASTQKIEDDGKALVGDPIGSRELDLSKGARATVFAAVDCTGHGVPGAFLSILGHDILNRSLKEASVKTPAEALEFLDRSMRETFERSLGGDEEVRDGMDLAMCVLDHESMELRFAGAQNPCYIVREGELHELKGNKRSIGEGEVGAADGFTDHSFQLQKGDAIYLFSDGFPDQFGGIKGKKFKYKPFKNLLASNSDRGMKEQQRILEKSFDDWKGDREQVDDVLVLGIRV